MFPSFFINFIFVLVIVLTLLILNEIEILAHFVNISYSILIWFDVIIEIYYSFVISRKLIFQKSSM